eukprot:CAMPEP_0194515818 /NCGR_PEP_ID=MMETSP0253-20130528/48573_1 /TAXON_ID=2966 /ORGANISM="Noctiluca scintillans" /LENGTH=516 /DNA_ID=CAMNT_0039359603 /DNA_START=21 /DNA_END=1567 /DNA_ORIENTATION=-
MRTVEEGTPEDRLEISPCAFALWNLIIRPPRRRYDVSKLGPKEFRLWSCGVKRVDVTLRNTRGMRLKCSHFVPVFPESPAEPQPCVIYLHANASCRLEALPLVPLFLPLGISLFTFDFAGCGESDGEYISLGWFERDDLAICVNYLRDLGTVSMIGLWGRSMGSVTALLHADRDHSIGGMVLDSPFSSLRTLATELAQSDYMPVKVPNWLLSMALGIGRKRIASLCNFDIDALAPEKHVGASFIPALFIAAVGDDFIAPHHTNKLFELYTGDKELKMVEGDHNSPRGPDVYQQAVLFLCRAFRMEPVQRPEFGQGGIARRIGLDAFTADCIMDLPIVTKAHREDASRLFAIAGGKVWLGDRNRGMHPVRVEATLQLSEPESEAGFTVAFFPCWTEWGGAMMPPVVYFVYCTLQGLAIALSNEAGVKVLKELELPIGLGEPVLLQLEIRAKPLVLTLKLGGGGPELVFKDDGEYKTETTMWLTWKQGEAVFFQDLVMSELSAEPVDDDMPLPTADSG